MPREKHAAWQRRSNIELLRIISMVIIVAHHFALYSGFVFPTEVLTLPRVWVRLLELGGKIGVNVFVLISGYFLISMHTVKTARVVKLWSQIAFYSLGLYAFAVAVRAAPLGVKTLLWHLIPVSSRRWWFASAYFMLYLLTPYLNRLLTALSQRQYAGLLLLLGVCWCLIPTVAGQMVESNHLLWFMYMYALGGYLQLFPPRVQSPARRYLLMALLLAGMTLGSAVLLDTLGTRNPYFASRAAYFYDMQKLPVVAISILLFLGFSRLEMRQSRFINAVSPAMFGVYLIHENQFIRPILWRTLFHSAAYANSALLIPYSLLAIALVLIGCTLIELLRIHLLEARCLPLFERIAAAIDQKKDWILDKLPGEK